MNIPELITGQEIIEDPTHPINTLVAFYKAFNARNANEAANNWAKQYAIAMSNPMGGIRRSWNSIKAGYDKIMGGEAKVYVEYYDYNLHQFNDIFYVEGRERGSLDIGDVHLAVKIRTSRIYKLFGSDWKQIHHHGSMENPELLKCYQQAIMKVL